MELHCLKCHTLMVPHDDVIFICLKCEAMIQVSDLVDFKELLEYWKKQPWVNESDL